MPYCTNVGFIPNDGLTANVLMHIIIYSTVYEKKKRICIRIGSVGLYIYFGIKATIKLLEKKGVLQIWCRNSLLSFSHPQKSHSW